MGHVCGSASVGIYCLPPGCDSTLEDEAEYPLAASAEVMGMRACLNCRPYRLAQTVTRSGQELVCRAVRMIVAGALDQGTEADLAERLGLSGRHLRRMFMVHLGVTPDGVARSGRVHFARRLLDDTDISITEIAFMAGFGSVRQSNRDCRNFFRGAGWQPDDASVR
jgi:AraC family transcriptional regulator of adaptative response / DNA-3-methyladenine glycosylase II